MGILILIKYTHFDPYLMALHVQTEEDKLVFSSEKIETLANLVGVKATYHHYTNKQKLEKHHVNGLQTSRNSVFD